jgi:hypothetical protein
MGLSLRKPQYSLGKAFPVAGNSGFSAFQAKKAFSILTPPLAE